MIDLEPSYITAAELKAATMLTGLIALADADLNKLILAAEGHVDDYCGRQPHHRYDSNTVRVFPREQDFVVTFINGEKDERRDEPEIPHDVSRATQAQAEWLFLQWWPTRATAQAPVRHAVEQRAVNADGSYSETRAGGGTDFSAATLCDAAKAILANGYRSRWAQLSTSSPC